MPGQVQVAQGALGLPREAADAGGGLERAAHANTSFGLERNGECEASPLGSTGGDNPHLERLEHLVALSKALNAFFQRQMEKVTDAVNEALNPQSLGLDAGDFGLPFNDNLRANNGKRVALSFGPVKRADRALKKAHEYGEFLFIIM